MSSLGLLAESFHTANDKMPRLKAFLKENPGASIVYITTQKVSLPITFVFLSVGILTMLMLSLANGRSCGGAGERQHCCPPIPCWVSPGEENGSSGAVYEGKGYHGRTSPGLWVQLSNAFIGRLSLRSLSAWALTKQISEMSSIMTSHAAWKGTGMYSITYHNPALS